MSLFILYLIRAILSNKYCQKQGKVIRPYGGLSTEVAQYTLITIIDAWNIAYYQICWQKNKYIYAWIKVNLCI